MTFTNLFRNINYFEHSMDSVTRKTFLFVLLQVIMSGKYRATGVEIQTKLGSAVHFLLPEVTICGRYNLTNPQKGNVITVYNTSHTLISNMYVRRSTNQSLDNGTLLFTLHHVQNSDEGTYLIEPGGQSPSMCWTKFVLTLIRDSPSTGYWLSWEPWSSCEKTCGSATRLRQRDCSIPSFCYHGYSLETSVCNDNPPCYDWSNWSDWSDCSVTCGNGVFDRHRFCLTHERQRTTNEHCIGNTYDKQVCSMTLCNVNQPITYQWTNWGSWNTCSRSCGTEYQTRDRHCHGDKTIVQSYMCPGSQTENRTCSLSSCDENGDDTGNNKMLKTGDQTVQLPLSGIVGTGAAVFILILAIVICVLVIKLKRKREILGIVKTGSVKKTSTISNKMYSGKKASVISCSSQGVSGLNVYDEIESDDVKSQRMSVITMDNPYVMMPKSASPRGSAYTNGGTVTYSNTEEIVFVFDNETPSGQSLCQNPKVTDAYQNTSTNLTVPRHMSVDSTGYLMPGNAMERAARRNKKYTKNKNTQEHGV